ncbi:MAG TPA: hypothetical protein VFL62_20165 [Bradyrhizobium sp.]|uniref:hypothetical protein n=1 Tax=Bradyrhizobium sp. TaxID=376 RepID=UPI002D7FFCC9|nr:hypothetical protein [Bradyrhizobium sp.]HET7888545.1 hypothetical protein [Bradyrhizobium sp.]
MNVAIDETRQDRSAGRVEAYGLGRNSYVSLSSRCNYSPVFDHNGAALDRLATEPINQCTADNRRQHSRALITHLKS